MSEKEKQLGVINEVGDLGLGFDLLSKEENEKITNIRKENKED